MDFETDQSLKDWARDKPLSILQLDPADRAVLRIADERDAIQKKTFTKWVNKHLKKANRQVNDLFVDLQDGLNLISLLEVLSGEHLHREKGSMRFHMLQNVELVLNFLRYKKIKLVNIRPEDIVDGNPKLTLGLIWTIILHFQISDIVVGEEPNVSAKDVLLRWAKRSTSKYPGVRVADFTQSWRDGLAFNAIIHRNRPDLIDWRQVRQRTARERLETAFNSAEKVGVTRLLDPEDVDRLEIDEKSIITYISSLYDVFPEPPAAHPLYDTESQALVTEYREVSSVLHLWLRERISTMSTRNLPNNLQELKRLSQESARFKTDDVPAKMRDKAKVQQIYRELQKYFEAVGEVDIEPELHVDVLERNWNRLMVAHQERDQLIQEEIKKQERVQRLAEKVQRDTKRADSRLDDLESRIQEESRRLERLHPLDAKANVDAIESEMRSTEEAVQSLFQDVASLVSSAHPQGNDLHKKVTKLHQRWVSLRSMLHAKLIARLASVSFPVVEERTVTRQSRTVVETRLVETDADFRLLQQAADWCRLKLKQIQDAEFGGDLVAAKSELSHHQREHKEIDQFHSRVDTCVAAKSNFHGEELTLYTQHVNSLQKIYAELLSLSNKRLSDLETLLDFFSSAHLQLSWLGEKEQVEVARDWSDKDLSVPALEQYYESMMSQLEKREVSVRSVMERGESLLLQGHPGAKQVESTLNRLQSQWAHVLQLTLALETHLKTTSYYQSFYRDLREMTAWIDSRDELLNSTYSASEFTLDEGERLLKGMQELRDDLNSKSSSLGELAVAAQSVSPIRHRRLPVARPIHVHAVCNYKQHGVEIEKGDRWLLHDNSALTKWRVSSGAGGPDTNVPGAVFLLPPPDREALDALERLSRSYERTLSLWQRKQLRMRQNMIFATIRVVRSWDLAQFVAMGSEQRNAIRRALNEDAEKLLTEGDPSDPQLRRLRREMEEVNRLFDEFERRARHEEENKNAARKFSDQYTSLKSSLDEAERTLNSRLLAGVPRDVHSLEHLVIQHKDFETSLKSLTSEVESFQSNFRAISRKTPAVQGNAEGVLKQWNALWSSSHLYIERLKCVEILLSALDEASGVISELEMKLATFGDMPSELEPLQNLHDDLIRLQNSIAGQQPVMDQLIEDAVNTRRVVLKSRERLGGDSGDLDRTDETVNATMTRWNNLCSQLVERLRSCEAAYGLLENYGKTYQTEVTFIDEAYAKLNNLPPVTQAKHHVEPTKVLFTSIVERTQPLEQVNIDGGRFIREAKIHNSRRRRWLEETASTWQPSVDAVRRNDPRRGEEQVELELGELNARYLAVEAVLRDRLSRAVAVEGCDPDLTEFVRAMEPSQLKTFRNLFESTPQPCADSGEDMGNALRSKTLMRKRRLEEGIGTGVIDRAGITDPSSGRLMTVGEAIRSRILDVRTGRFNAPGGSLTIPEAKDRGWVDERLSEDLVAPGPGGISLLEAIQTELAQAETKVGTDILQKRVRTKDRGLCVTDAKSQNVFRDGRVLDRFTGKRYDLEKAAKMGVVDPDVREVPDASTDTMITVKEALRKNVDVSFTRKPMTLKDAIENELYKNGEIRTPGGNTVDVLEAIRRGILDGEDLNCVTDTSKSELVSLQEAINRGIIDGDVFTDRNTGEILDVNAAVERGWISSVSVRSVFDVDCFKFGSDYLSFNAALETGVLKDGVYVTDVRSGRSVPITVAAEEGLVRTEVYELLERKIGIMCAGKELTAMGAALKGYLDPKTGEIFDRKRRTVCYDEALKRKMISGEGLDALLGLLRVTLTTQTVTKTRRQTVTRIGFVEGLTRYEVPADGWYLKEAIDRGLFDPVDGLLVIQGTDRLVTLEECVELGIVHPSSARVVHEDRKTLSLSRSLEKRVLDSTGHYRDLTMKEAIKRGLVILEERAAPHPDGREPAEPLRISPGTIFDPSTALVIFTDTGISRNVLEAVQEGRIDASKVTVRDPSSGRPVPLRQALDRNLLTPQGEYSDKSGRKISLVEAAKTGILTVLGAPLVPVGLLKKALVEDPKTGENVTLEVAIERGIDKDLIRKYEEKIRVVKTDQEDVDLLKKTGDAFKKGIALVSGATKKKNVPEIALNLKSSKLPLKEAIHSRIIDPDKSEIYLQISNETKKFTVRDALDKGLVGPNSIVDASDKNKLVLEETRKIRLSRHLTAKGLALRGVYDPKTGDFLDPRSLTVVDFEDLVKNGLFSESVLVKMPDSSEVYVSLRHALESGIVDRSTGEMLDHRTGRSVDLFEAVKLGWILESGVRTPRRPLLGLKEALSKGVFDPEVVALAEGVTEGLLDPGRIVVRTDDGRLPLEEAVDRGSIDLNSSTHKYRGMITDLKTAFKQGHIRDDSKSVSLQAAVRLFYSPDTCKFTDELTKQDIDLEDALERGLIDADISKCRDTKSDNILSVEESIERSILAKGKMKDTKKNKSMSLDLAVREGLILTEQRAFSIIETVENRCYDPKSGLILDPATGDRLNLRDSLNRVVDPRLTRIRGREGVVSTEEAIKNGLLDDKKGVLTYPMCMNLELAHAKGFIIPSERPWTLSEALAHDCYDSSSGKMCIDGTPYTLQECLDLGYLNPDAPTVKDGEILTLKEAMSSGLVDPIAGTIKGLKLDEASKKGLILPAKRKVSLPEAVRKGLYDPDTGKFTDAKGREYPTKRAIEKGILDPGSTMVKIDGKTMTFEHALEENLIDKKGMVRLQDKRLDFQEAFEQGVLIEVRRPVPLREALEKIYDHGMFLDTRTGEYVPLGVALEAGILEADDVLFVGEGRRTSLKEAMQRGLMDGYGRIGDLDIREAFRVGVLVDGSQISLQKAIQRGLYDPATGRITDPRTGEKMSLNESLRRSFINPGLPLCSDKNKLISLGEACRSGIVDKRRGRFGNIDLATALLSGKILNIETCHFDLYDALSTGIYKDGFLVHPRTGERLSLRESLEELIDPSSLVLENGVYVKLSDAVEFNDSDLQEALELRRVVPNRRNLDLQEAVDCGLYVRDKGIVDPQDNEVLDVRGAVGRGLVAGDTTAVRGPSRLRSLRESLDDSTVEGCTVRDPDSEQRVDISAAFSSGLLLTLDRFVPPESPSSCTLQEALDLRLLDVENAVLKDPEGKIIPLKDALNLGLVDSSTKSTSSKNRVYDFSGTQIFSQRPVKFSETPGLTSDGLVTVSGREMNLRDAVEEGFLDSDSLLVKDTLKKRHMKIPEAYKRGILDDKGNVLDTADSRLLNAQEALDKSVLTSGPISLIEALDYGLYNPVTGSVTDPFSSGGVGRRRLQIREAISSGLLDGTSSVIRDHDRISTLNEATQSGLLDPNAGKFIENGRSIDLLKARDRGYIIPAETRQAMEEKYKMSDSNLKELLEWISELEDRLANQDVAQEDMDMLRNQINLLKLIKEELESQHRTVSSCLDQVRVVVTTGSEYLTRDEVGGLERNGKSLRNRYDRANEKTDKLLRRLAAANEELSKFKSELGTFLVWMDKAERTLDEREKWLASLNKVESSDAATRDFVSDVIAHQADLRFITMAAQKFFDESKEYLSVLNDLRSSLPSRLPHVEPLSSSESSLRSSVATTTTTYRELLNRSNRLADRVSGVGGRQREYGQSLERARMWLAGAETRAAKVVGEAVAADPHGLEEQLTRAKALSAEFLGQSRLLDNLNQALEGLLRAVEGQISAKESGELETPVRDANNRYERLRASLSDRCASLDASLVQSQGLEDSLESVSSWLTSAENQLKSGSRPASLNRERLEEQLRETRVLMADVEARRGSVEGVSEEARAVVSGANPRLAKRVEAKLRDVLTRYEKLCERTRKRSELLAEISTSVASFSSGASETERWLGENLEAVTDVAAKLEDLAAQKDGKRDNVERLLRDGKALVAKKDVTDTSATRDRIKSIESQWRELTNLLEDKQRLSKVRQEQTLAYEKLREQVLHWLISFESRFSRLEPVALSMDMIKKQAEDLKPLSKEHRDYGLTVDKLFDLGNGVDSLTRPESPTRRRSTTSPVKRTSIVPLVRRPSHEGSPSPTKSAYSPISPGGSSGFGSRRSSQEAFHLEELSGVQQELSEVNNRYSLLGTKISDRQSELDNTRDELRKTLEQLKTLDVFLDRVAKTLPRESLPPAREDADKMNRLVKGILEEMYEKQSLLESTRSGVSDLVRRKSTAVGADALADQLADVGARWKSLNDACKSRIRLLEDVKDAHETLDALSGWLNAKGKMMGALGPISSDPRMVETQIQQVQVMRDEFRAQAPQLAHLAEIGASVLERVQESPESGRMRTRMGQVEERWRELSSRLESRGESLGAAVDSTREFDNGLARLRDALQGISEQIDRIPQDKEAEEQLRKMLICERQLEGVRSLLADAEAAGEELCRVLSDPATRAEIVAKLGAVNKQYNALQAKLDQRKAEIEAALRDGRELDASCSRTLGWLLEELNAMTDRLLVSADREALQQQIDSHEPVYKEVLSKEHEVIMLLDKARDREKQVENVKSQWEKLKRETLERHTRLHTAMEHCRKYYKCVESFIPWLAQSENKLDSLRPENLTRREVDKHTRDLATFRSEVWKKSGEFEHLRSLGETFHGACDVDKEVVKQEMAAIRDRWEKLNNELMSRISNLEEVARRLGEMTEKMRDLGHSVQRCEDKLASHDSLGAAANDPAMLNTLKGVKEDAAGLVKPVALLRENARLLETDATRLGLGRGSLSSEATALHERLCDLESRLEDRCAAMQSAATAVAAFNDELKTLTNDLSGLESELDAMKPPGREIKLVRGQEDEIRSFLGKLARASREAGQLLASADGLMDSGLSRDATKRQAEVAARQLAGLEERSRSRAEMLEGVLERLLGFQESYRAAIQDIEHLDGELRRLKPIGSEVETIRSQQEELGRVRGSVDPVARAVEDVNRSGQGLVQSAQGGVSTVCLEKDLEKMNDKWNALKEKMNERGRKLDSGLLQSGKFQEALEGLNKWLTDTEEMVANQRPPSADYKVVKAQMQEQKFLKKMLVDRQGSMSSLVAMGNDVAAGADSAERASIERQLAGLMSRFEDLTQAAASRMTALEQAMSVAKLFQDRLSPVTDWLDRTEKKVREMELVPTDEEKIQQRIREHDSLHNEILRKKPALSDLTETGSQLMSLVGEDEASLVLDRIQDTAERYSSLVDASDALGTLLESSRSGLRHLVITYQGLQGWMEGMEGRLGRYRVLAVHTEKLLSQMEDLADLTEEVAEHQGDVDGTVDSGLELMKHISGDEALQLKEKLDSLQRRYNELTTRGADLLKQTQEALPLVQQFHNSHSRLVDWMMCSESALQTAEPREDDMNRLEHDLGEFRPVLENVNQIGPQLCGLSPGEGASTIEGLVSRDNRRFDSLAEQIQRKAERLHLSKQRSLEVLGDIDSLLEWFREVEAQLREAEPPSSEPHVIRLQLKEHKALNDDIASQKGRVRDVLATAKRVVRESSFDDDASLMRDKMSDLREVMESVWTASGERLSRLEEAAGLADHLLESHGHLLSWLLEMENHVRNLPLPAIKPDLIAHQQDRTEMLLQSISEHKPLVDKLNKTGETLLLLVAEDETIKIQEILDNDNTKYTKLRQALKSRQETLEKALQESSQFSDKLEGMLRALAGAAEEVTGAEPVSAHVQKIKQQLKENRALVEDLKKREEAFRAVRRAAQDVIAKAPDASDPQVKDVKRKLERLNCLWDEVQEATRNRSKSLEDALSVAARFWSELQSVMSTLADLEASLASQEPPGVRPQAIDQQRRALEEIRTEMETTKPEVEMFRHTGASLMSLCGEPDRPEVKKQIEDVDTAWDNVTAMFARREENLLDAMEKAMEFHETLRELLAFLESAEERFSALGPLGSDIEVVKSQMADLKAFKMEIDPQMVKVESLNRQAQELTERSSAEQALGLKEALSGANTRWEDLQRGVAERNRQLENGLLRLGQFRHALAELLAWMETTERGLDADADGGIACDAQVLEAELARLRVAANDVQAHRASVDTLNDAGRQIVEGARDSVESASTLERLGDLHSRWRRLLEKTGSRQSELEAALRDAQRFAAEIQDLLSWLGEVDGVMAASKPVGGLPETASEQLDRFMDVYDELEHNRAKVEAVLGTGQEYLKKSSGNSSQNLQANLKTLKQRWDSVTARANDKRIKLEIALKEATEFHDALQAFVDWLTSAEKTLTNLRPVSRVLETILGQIEEHKSFQKEVGAHRETMIQLDKKGTHLKYFSQKQDVILIKNLLISVQHRWERVVSKSAERTRGLDHGYKEAKELHDSWSSLMAWLAETETTLDEVASEIEEAANDPQRLKLRLNRHRETQKQLAAKQPQYDSTLRAGKTIRERAPKTDEAPLRAMLAQLKERWNTVCAKAVDRQRKLEEALLYCGQFKDALEALLDWLRKTNAALRQDALVHGDLDTVNALVESHRVLESELASRSSQVETVERSGRELSSRADGAALSGQLGELAGLWESARGLAGGRSAALAGALREAEELHKAVHMLLEWLSDAEMKLRFVENLPDDEAETRSQMGEHEKFMREMREKEREKEATIALAERILAKAHPDGVTVINHWITIIQSRWEEVSTWARQRETRLEDHLRSLQDLDTLLEELLAWLASLESTLVSLEHEPLPKEIPVVKGLIEEHQVFMEKMASRQNEVDTVCKAKQQKEKERKPSGKKTSTGRDESRQSTQDLHELSRKQSLKSSRDNLGTLDRKASRGSPGRDPSEGVSPHIGPKFPPKGSKGSEPTFRSPRARLLWDRWRSVWLASWDRQRRLQEWSVRLEEELRLANFTWDDWRKRFLRFMNHKKSRLTDLFRKMDKNNDNLIPREDFVEGIIRTKFDTNRPEMGAVADMFDHNSEGIIDWKEFIAALRPDWEEKRPLTEAEKIHDEVKRLVMLCTCRQKFRVFQVGEGKYRFGDSQKLRLVRILRSTVMVRVGGGWVALDEFLVKNDPCRAKGRTNIELREQFILADGVSQSMSAFRPKSSLQGGTRSYSTSTASSAQGPITKVRERSTRSVPMTRSTRTPGSVDSLSDNEPSSPLQARTPSRRLRPSALTPGGSLPGSRNSSRPASRQGSKPPSRHGSSLSLASSDDGTPSRIPRRSVPARGSGTTTPTRKLTVPAINGRSKSPATAAKSTMQRASSIPTLGGNTPRGRTTPTGTGSTSKLTRRESEKKTATEPKAPFKL